MKTAMQQLIEHLDPIHSGIRLKAYEMLEIEKQQILEAIYHGQFIYDDVDAENYYKSKYNIQ